MKNLLLVAALFVAVVSATQEVPKIANAKIEQRSASGGIEQQVHNLASKTTPVWIAYAEPVIAGDHTMCCFRSGGDKSNTCCGGCALERDRGSFNGKASDCGPLEPAKSFFIFMRASSGQVEKVRTFSTNCAIDGSGASVDWLNDVKASDSIAFLEKLALNRSEQRRDDAADGAIAAIAMHADPSADDALDRLISTAHNDHMVEQATFWTGSARGSRGYEILAAQLEHNQSHSFRKNAVFALSQNSDPRSQKKLIDLARHDSDPETRSESIFWLAQKAGSKAAGVISDAISNDPNTEVKKKAVFALSELPKDEGVPLLIDQAKRNPNPIVRKEAIFWLGQSEDPRALDFIASILEN